MFYVKPAIVDKSVINRNKLEALFMWFFSKKTVNECLFKTEQIVTDVQKWWRLCSPW